MSTTRRTSPRWAAIILSLLRHLGLEIRIHVSLTRSTSLLKRTPRDQGWRTRNWISRWSYRIDLARYFIRTTTIFPLGRNWRDESSSRLDDKSSRRTSLYCLTWRWLAKRFKQQNLRVDSLFAPGEIFKDLVAALAQMVKLETAESEVCSKSLVGFFQNIQNFLSNCLRLMSWESAFCTRAAGRGFSKFVFLWHY